MRPLYLIGTGGLAREILGWLVFEKSPLLTTLKGFLVTDEKRDRELIHGYPVVHVDQMMEEFNFIPTLGNSLTKKKVIQQLIAAQGHPLSYVSNTVPIGLNVSIGKGVIINPRSSISSDSIIGNYVLINCNTGVGHDTIIGDYTSILGNAAINGDVEIGAHCLIGAGTIIHPGKKVEDEATVGMGAVVFKNVKKGSTVLGNPAKKL